MKISSLVTGLCVTVLVSNILFSVYGPAGVIALKDLRSQQSLLMENVSKLRLRNTELQSTLSSLRDGSAKLAIAAHDSGMVFPDDTKIRLVQRSSTMLGQSPGNLVAIKKPQTVNPMVLRIISLVIGISFTLVLALATIEEKVQPRRRRPYQGIRVQTASLK